MSAIPPFRLRLEGVTVVFGDRAGERLPEHLSQLSPQRILVFHGATGAPLGAQLCAAFGPERSRVFTDIAQHVPAALAESAVADARTFGADTVVAIGGGSAIGFAKIVARDTGARVAAVPTTYSGSEMTPMWGLTTAGGKTTGRDVHVMPQLVVYDPLLTLDLPASTSAASGMNAMAHAVDAMYAGGASPLVSTIAVESIGVLAPALRRIVEEPRDAAARTDALYGAHLAGLALGTTSMALHHRICHVLGGRFGLPHAETHAVVLPHAVSYNRRAAPAVDAGIAAALGGDDASLAIWELERALRLPESLAALGLRDGDVDAAADDIVATTVPNPAAVTREGVRRLLQDALHGQPPRA